MFYKIFTDGGARGNPGPGAIGVVIYDENDNLIARFGKTAGRVTNNIAEYLAVLESLFWVKSRKTDSNKPIKIEFYLDSKLVASQLGGVFKIKEPKLKNLFTEIQFLIAELKANVVYTHIAREKNELADQEVNKALDREFFPA